VFVHDWILGRIQERWLVTVLFLILVLRLTELGIS
jgi:hypothetical protein